MPLPGDYRVTIAGQVYTLRLSMAAMIACEEAERQPDGAVTPFHIIAARAGRSEMLAMRLVFWALLRKHHAEVSLEEAGDLFMQAREEGINVMDATADGVPEKADLQILEGSGQPGPGPQKRARGKGSSSSGPMAASPGRASTDGAGPLASPEMRSTS